MQPTSSSHSKTKKHPQQSLLLRRRHNFAFPSEWCPQANPTRRSSFRPSMTGTQTGAVSKGGAVFEFFVWIRISQALALRNSTSANHAPLVRGVEQLKVLFSGSGVLLVYDSWPSSPERLPSARPSEKHHALSSLGASQHIENLFNGTGE